MSVAQFPENNLSFLSYYVADVSEDGSIMLISSHNTTHSNLYVSDIVSEHEVITSIFKQIIRCSELGTLVLISIFVSLQINLFFIKYLQCNCTLKG